MWLRICVLFFFFKQKTAYEMRISDWSSDVCSSDLKALIAGDPQELHAGWRRYSTSLGDDRIQKGVPALLVGQHGDQRRRVDDHRGNPSSSHNSASISAIVGYERLGTPAKMASTSARKVAPSLAGGSGRRSRSEDHTSELQSILRTT